MNQDKENQQEQEENQNKQAQQEPKGIDVKLEGKDRGTKTMRQRKMNKNVDDASTINDDFSLDQNSDPISAKRQ